MRVEGDVDNEVGSAWSVTPFRRFTVARALAWIGSTVTLVAMPLLVFQMSGSPALTGLIAAGEAVPYLILGLPAGALADRWNRRRVLMVTSGASSLVVASVPAAEWSGGLTVGHVLLTGLAVSALFVFFDAAAFGAVPEMVGRERLASATGLMMTVSTVISIAGPAMGGVLSAWLGPATAIGADALGFGAAAMMFRVMRWDTPEQPSGKRLAVRDLSSDIVEGLRFLWQSRIIRQLTLIGSAASVTGGAMTGLIVVVAVENLGMHSDDGRIGLLFAASAVGAFVSGLSLSRVQNRVRTGSVTLAALVASWAAVVMFALNESLVAAWLLLAAYQAAATLSILNGIVVRQTLTPNRLQSRVNTTARMVAWGGTPLGAALGGILAQAWSARAALMICSLVLPLAVLGALASGIWRVPRLGELAAEADV